MVLSPPQKKPTALHVADVAGQDLELQDPVVEAVREPDLLFGWGRVVRTGTGRACRELRRLLRIEVHAEVPVVSHRRQVGVDPFGKDAGIADIIASRGEALVQTPLQAAAAAPEARNWR